MLMQRSDCYWLQDADLAVIKSNKGTMALACGDHTTQWLFGFIDFHAVNLLSASWNVTTMTIRGNCAAPSPTKTLSPAPTATQSHFLRHDGGRSGGWLKKWFKSVAREVQRADICVEKVVKKVPRVVKTLKKIKCVQRPAQRIEKVIKPSTMTPLPHKPVRVFVDRNGETDDEDVEEIEYVDEVVEEEVVELHEVEDPLAEEL